VLEGEGGAEVFLAVENGKMSGERTRPAGLPLRFCVAAPIEAIRGALQMLEDNGSFTHEHAPLRVAGLASGKMDKLLEKEKLAFHVNVKNVPDLETITIRVGVSVDGPPEKPGFTVGLDYDDLEEVRAGQLTPQQLFMKKLKIVGDASRAMTLAMTMIQQQRR
jgi:putative sterol carrier protein